MLGVCVVAEAASGVLLGAATALGREPGASLMLLIGSFAAVAVVVLLAPWVVRRLTGEPTVLLSRPGALGELAAGLVMGTVLITMVFAVLALAGAYRVTDVGWSTGITVGLYTGLVAGFAEELLFRGVLFRLVEKRVGTLWSLAVSSLVFGLLHLANPDATLPGAVAIAAEAGILLAACYVLTRRLWFAIGVHAAWNFVQGGVFGSDVSGSGTGRGLLEGSFSGPVWLTGGDMGVEASVVAVLICLVAGAAVLAVARRRGLLLARAEAPGRRR
nr:MULTISPECIES: CPBP family intramembrane glutamic endopeptidase [unclassified Actinomyces]